MAETGVAAGSVMYRGEVASRRLGIAVLLSLLMPGLGHVYCGRLRRGLVVYASALLAGLTFLAVAWFSGMFMMRAVAIVATGWAYLQVASAARLHRWIERHGSDYVLQGVNHPVVYLVLWTLLELLPLLLLFSVLSAHVFYALPMKDRSAFPQLLPGDLVYADRLSTARTPLGRGELVVLSGDDSPAGVLRVVGVAGDEISYRDGVLSVNGERRYREPLGRLEVVNRDPAPAEVEGIRAFREYVDGVSYVVYVPDGMEAEDLAPVRVGEGELYVLADLRDVEGVVDSRVLGPLPQARVVGRPLFVWWSRDLETGRVRWHRIGLAVR